MSDFFWNNGHLGWGIFFLAVFTGLWWLLSDLAWRVRNVRIRRLAVAMATGWAAGVGLILLGCYLGSR
jgi:hypothetical protein